MNGKLVQGKVFLQKAPAASATEALFWDYRHAPYGKSPMSCVRLVSEVTESSLASKVMIPASKCMPQVMVFE